eukprot:gene1003-324_t
MASQNNLYFEHLKEGKLEEAFGMCTDSVTAEGIYDGEDEEILKQIENGDYSIIHASPESVLVTERWRKLFDSPSFKENCRYLMVDGAHCIVYWGTTMLRGTTDGETSNVPFRKWYGNLLELKALLDKPRMAVFTATATKTTKRRTFNLLQLHYMTTAIFEKIQTRKTFAVLCGLNSPVWGAGGLSSKGVVTVNSSGALIRLIGGVGTDCCETGVGQASFDTGSSGAVGCCI